MKVELPPDLESLVKKQMAAQHSDAMQVIADALYSYELHQDTDHFADWDEEVLKQEVRKGFEQLDKGEYGDVSIDDIVTRLENMKNTQ